MKKNVLIVIGMLMLCMSNFAENKATIFLWHNGQVTTYDVHELSSAVNDAVNGDTIFLANGLFSPTVSTSIDITKSITLIGAGMGESYRDAVQGGGSCLGVNYDIYIKSPNVRFENVFIWNNVYLYDNNCKFKKCRFRGSINCDNHPINMENCYVYEGVSNFTNSKFYNSFVGLYNGTESEFLNCDLTSSDEKAYETSSSTFSGCRLESIASKGLKNCVLFNCLYDSHYSPSSLNNRTNCYAYYGEVTDLSISDLQSNGYLGIDGTVVGRYGGETPFTLAPNQPVVTANSITLDYENKQLNVSLEVKVGE